MTTSRSRPRSWAASNLEADRSWSRITLRPGAIRAGVIRKKDGISFGPNGEVAKRFGFHTLRHSLASCLMYEPGKPRCSTGDHASQQDGHDARLLALTAFGEASRARKNGPTPRSSRGSNGNAGANATLLESIAGGWMVTVKMAPYP
jgi:hypothetical protein